VRPLRKQLTSGNALTVRAIARTYLVRLGFDITPENRQGLLGFAIHRVDHPMVITGSVNFSKNSSTENDENQLLIFDEPAVTDVYLTEFMRMYDHYTFRFFLTRMEAGLVDRFLKTDDYWTDKYFNDELERRDRLIFSGQD